MRRKLMAILFLVTIALAALTSIAYAGADSQPVEWIDNPGYLRWSLRYLGPGWMVWGDKCDWNDYVFRINKNASADPDRYRIFSYDSKVANAFRDKSPMGHLLNSTQPYLCLGYGDTVNAGGPYRVWNYLFVWVQ
ncbi:MAG: hypothetical protein QXX08_06330 [Candidatus Bathyarchaeia archaeon]